MPVTIYIMQQYVFVWLGIMKVIHSILSFANHPPYGASQPTASRVSRAIGFMNLHGCECEQQWWDSAQALLPNLECYRLSSQFK